jgi:hypothetical protein
MIHTKAAALALRRGLEATDATASVAAVAAAPAVEAPPRRWPVMRTMSAKAGY